VVVAVFSLVSLVWKTDYFVDFLEIEFFGLLLALWVAAQACIITNS
jgi:uncharacterized membrane protein